MTADIQSVQHDGEKLSVVMKRDEVPLHNAAAGRISRGDRSGVIVCLQEFEAAVSSALVSLSQRTDGIAREVMEMHCTTLDQALDTLKKIEHNRTLTIYDGRKISWARALWYKILNLIGYCCGGNVYVALNHAPLSSTVVQDQLSHIRSGIALSSPRGLDPQPSSPPEETRAVDGAQRPECLSVPRDEAPGIQPPSAHAAGRPVPVEIRPRGGPIGRPFLSQKNVADGQEFAAYWAASIEDDVFEEGKRVLEIFSAITCVRVIDCSKIGQSIKVVFATTKGQDDVPIVKRMTRVLWNTTHLPTGGHFEQLLRVLYPEQSLSYSSFIHPNLQQQTVVTDTSSTENRILDIAWERFTETEQVGEFIIVEVKHRLEWLEAVAQQEGKETVARAIRERCPIYDQLAVRVLEELRSLRHESKWSDARYGIAPIFLKTLPPEELKEIVQRDLHDKQRIDPSCLPQECRRETIQSVLDSEKSKIPMYRYLHHDQKLLDTFFTIEEQKEIVWQLLAGEDPSGLLYCMSFSPHISAELFQRLTLELPEKAWTILQAQRFMRHYSRRTFVEAMNAGAQKLAASPVKEQLIARCNSLLRR
jgi:hypothetical protein